MRRELDVHPHVPEERAEHFQCHDGGSTEVEYLELLAALVRVTKPDNVLETGAWEGYGTLALARACEANGFGRVYSLECDEKWASIAAGRLALESLSHRATVVQRDSLAYLAEPGPVFQMAFFDSHLPIRVDEMVAAHKAGRLARGCLIAFHDTSKKRAMDGGPDAATGEFWSKWFKAMEDLHIQQVVEFPLSRGMVIGRVR